MCLLLIKRARRFAPLARIRYHIGKRTIVRLKRLYLRGKEIIFTFHARRRMMERRITEEQVIRVLENPDTERPARSRGCRRAERKLGFRKFGVVYEEVW